MPFFLTGRAFLPAGADGAGGRPHGAVGRWPSQEDLGDLAPRKKFRQTRLARCGKPRLVKANRPEVTFWFIILATIFGGAKISTLYFWVLWATE